jgi:hypothetical protein
MQADVVQFLVADLQQREMADPPLRDVAADAGFPARGLDARIAGVDARACGGLQRQHGLRGAGVEDGAQLRAVQFGGADGVRQGVLARFDGDFEEGLALRPIGHGFVTPDLVRGPLCGEGDGRSLLPSPAARWTPEQVRGDG